MMRGLPLVMLLSGPAMAQEWIDFDLLMQQNAARVVVTTDTAGHEVRTLDMGDGVTVTCDDEGCMGMDTSGKGALGCTFAILTSVRAFAEVCEIPLTEVERTTLVSAFDMVGGVVARNAVPPRSASYPMEVLAREKADLQTRSPDLGAECRAADTGDAGQMLRAIIAGWDAEKARADLSDSRLPVMNPCL